MVDPADPAPAGADAGLTVVVPVYNEVESVAGVLDDLLAAADRHGWRVVVVDDGSDDGTTEILARRTSAHLQVLRHSRNRGYGAALKSGVRAATTPYVATMDADGQHGAAQLLALIAALHDQAMIIGLRRGIGHSPLWRWPGKVLLNGLARLMVGRRIPDLNSGLRVIRRETITRYLHLCPDGFSFSTTSTFVLLHRGYAVDYVPVDVAARKGTSAVTLGTGFGALLLVLRLAMLLAPLRIFLPMGAVLIVAGALWTIPYTLAGRGITVAALLLILAGLLTILFGLLADQISELRKERFEA